jgi:hypothetical protein
MARILLSSGQVSTILSIGIIVSFTFALFLAGYILQQETLHTLQAAIRPQLPVSSHHGLIEPLQNQINPSKSWYFGSSIQKIRDRLYTQPASFDWSRFAHAQLARNNQELSHALILFHELHKLRSGVPRVLLFPRIWLRERSIEEGHDRELETTVRLLRKASRQYRVILLPIEPISKDANGEFHLWLDLQEES